MELGFSTATQGIVVKGVRKTFWSCPVEDRRGSKKLLDLLGQQDIKASLLKMSIKQLVVLSVQGRIEIAL